MGDAGPVGLDLAALSAWFLGAVPAATGPLSATLLHGGRSNLTYDVTDGVTHWIVRRPPLGLVAPSANDVGREYVVMAALHGSGVPVPEAVAFCADPSIIGVPFAVVSMVEGDVIRTVDDGAAVGVRAGACGAALVTALADLHAVDPSAVGLGDLGRPDGYLARQLRRWQRQWDVVRTRPLSAIDRLHAGLERRLPAARRSGLVHGDYRIDNVIFTPGDPTRIAAVVDWEMATLGDPLADLGLLLVYQDVVCSAVIGAELPMASNPSFPRPDELADLYAGATGSDLDQLGFYVALGYLKVAVIAEGIHRRYLDGDTVGPGFEVVGASVPQLVDAGLDHLDWGP